MQVGIIEFVCWFFSVRDGDTVKHYRIRQLDEGGFFIARRTTFRTLQDLVEHYSKDMDGLCVNLKQPCVQVGRHKLKCNRLMYTHNLTSRWSLDSLQCCMWTQKYTTQNEILKLLAQRRLILEVNFRLHLKIQILFSFWFRYFFVSWKKELWQSKRGALLASKMMFLNFINWIRSFSRLCVGWENLYIQWTDIWQTHVLLTRDRRNTREKHSRYLRRLFFIFVRKFNKWSFSRESRFLNEGFSLFL